MDASPETQISLARALHKRITELIESGRARTVPDKDEVRVGDSLTIGEFSTLAMDPNAWPISQLREMSQHVDEAIA